MKKDNWNMENQYNKNTENASFRETPKIAKIFFEKYLFPCKQDKSANVTTGQSWSEWILDKETNQFIKNTKEVVRSIVCQLCGLDCGQADLVIVDIDIYKEDFKKSKEAQSFLEICLKKSRFIVKTPGGGIHIFFRQPKNMIIGCPQPFPAVEVKGRGGYVCLYGLPFVGNIYENYQDMWGDLPEFPFGDFKDYSKENTNQDKTKCEFGPNKNSKATISRSTIAGLKKDPNLAMYDLDDMDRKNAGRIWDRPKYKKDYLTNFAKAWVRSDKKEDTIPVMDKDLIKPAVINSQPREWFMNERLFIKGRPNMIVADAGSGKSTLTRFIAYRYWEKYKGTILLFTQEDCYEEDISPWLQSKGHKYREKIQRFYVFPDWTKFPIQSTLLSFREVKEKLVIIDPVHSLFEDISKPKQCREILLNIQNSCLIPGDTSVYVNHPKAMWKERKLTASEVNAGTKELSRVCRGALIMKLNKETGLNILEHTKRQLSADRYSCRIVENLIVNHEDRSCTYSDVEDFQSLSDVEYTDDALMPIQKQYSKDRKKIRDFIRKVLVTDQTIREWTPKKTLSERFSELKIKEWKLDRELAGMVKEGILDRKTENI